MIELIYLARHGFRLNWVTTTWTNPTGMPRDPPLAAHGEAQAEELAKHFLDLPLDARPTAIFCSPYYRTLQTAKPVAAALGLPIYVEHGITEWYSPVAPGSGLHPRPGSAESLQKFFEQIDPSWSPTLYSNRRGESVDEVHQRTDDFLHAFVPRVEVQLPATVHKRIVLITHAATAITLIRGLLADRGLYPRIACCSLTTFARKLAGEDATQRPMGEWMTQGEIGDTSFLSKGRERDWGFEDVEVEHGRVIDDHGIPGTENDVDDNFGLQVPVPVARF